MIGCESSEEQHVLMDGIFPAFHATRAIDMPIVVRGVRKELCPVAVLASESRGPFAYPAVVTEDIMADHMCVAGAAVYRYIVVLLQVPDDLHFRSRALDFVTVVHGLELDDVRPHVLALLTVCNH